MKKSIPVLLMGCGGVGRQLLDHIINCRSLHSKQGLILRVLGVCDSRSLLVVNDVSSMEFDDASLAQIYSAKSSGSSLSNLLDIGKCQIFKDSEAKKRVIDIAGLLGRSTGLAVVDCSASSETIETLKQLVDHGCCIVLANKKPLTCAIEDHEKLMSEFRCIRFESTIAHCYGSVGEALCLGIVFAIWKVGAGLPVIASVTRLLASGDPIYRVIGSLSGTLGYVMSEVEDGKLFSQVVQAAKSLGYTEPDPRDDLSGMDVARKGLILARLLGQRISMSDIKVESLYPDELGPNSLSTKDFINSGLLLLDRDISERVKAASLKGNVLRYVCRIEGSSCQVGLQELPEDSPLGRLRGSDNVVEIYSRCYKDSPLVIQGAGAGNDTTAAGVLADIIDLQDLF